MRFQGRGPGRRRPGLTVRARWMLAGLCAALVVLAAGARSGGGGDAAVDGPREVGLGVLLEEIRAAGGPVTVTVDGAFSRLEVDLDADGTPDVAARAGRGVQDAVMDRILDTGADVVVTPLPGPGALDRTVEVVSALGPLVVLGLLVVLVLRFLRSGPAGRGDWRAAEVPTTRFADVGGLDHVVAELAELVTHLRDPGRIGRLGGVPPRGVLLTGPPGCGKTLLARAVAGEAGVRFFSVSGSEFTEIYVGVGASRLRRLFAAARKAAPAVVFIDEIDSLARARSDRSDGASAERDATLNQLLVELDGFDARSGIVVMAATNRPDLLDGAVTRPGRFDRRITVPLPDRAGRRRILGVLASRYRMAPGVDLDLWAERTGGFSGADLENLCNQAALAAARGGVDAVEDRHLEDAHELVALGRPSGPGPAPGSRERRLVAWHEAGHAVAAMATPGADPPRLVSILPRGSAGGVTWFDNRDDLFITLTEARARLVVLLAGREAERLLCGSDVTQGAENDLEVAARLARTMVSRWGMTVAGAGWVTGQVREDREVSADAAALIEAAAAVAARVVAVNRDVIADLAGHLERSPTLRSGDLDRFAARVRVVGGRDGPAGGSVGRWRAAVRDRTGGLRARFGPGAAAGLVGAVGRLVGLARVLRAVR